MDRYTIKLIYYDIQSTSEKAAIKNCLIAHDDSGEWVRYEDAAAHIEELELRIADESRACALFQSHISELEAQLAAMQQIIDGYKDDLKIPENVLGVLKLAYRKHHLLDESVGSTELSDFLMDTICDLIGDDGFQKWLDECEQCGLDNRPIMVVD